MIYPFPDTFGYWSGREFLYPIPNVSSDVIGRICIFLRSDNRFQVMDHATRSMSQLDEGGGSELSCHAFSLILLENSDGKTKDFVLACESE